MAIFLPPIISIFQFILSVLCMHTMNRVPLHTPSPSFTPSCTPSPSSSSQSVLLLLPLIPTAPVRSLWFQWPHRIQKGSTLCTLWLLQSLLCCSAPWALEWVLLIPCWGLRTEHSLILRSVTSFYVTALISHSVRGSVSHQDGEKCWPRE